MVPSFAREELLAAMRRPHVVDAGSRAEPWNAMCSCGEGPFAYAADVIRHACSAMLDDLLEHPDALRALLDVRVHA